MHMTCILGCTALVHAFLAINQSALSVHMGSYYDLMHQAITWAYIDHVQSLAKCYLTWLMIGWQHSCQPVRSHVSELYVNVWNGCELTCTGRSQMCTGWSAVYRQSHRRVCIPSCRSSYTQLLYHDAACRYRRTCHGAPRGHQPWNKHKCLWEIRFVFLWLHLLQNIGCKYSSMPNFKPDEFAVGISNYITHKSIDVIEYPCLKYIKPC